MRKTYKFYFELNIYLKNLHYLSFLAITIAVCQIEMILTLIPLQNQYVGMGIWAKHSNFIQSGIDSQKTPFLVVFGYNNCSVSNPNDFNTHTSSKSTCWDGDMRKTYKFYSDLKVLFKNLHQLSFLAITIALCQIQMILTLIPLQNEHDGMRKCAKHKKKFQRGNDSQKTPFLVVFGYNNCSVSNANDFNTHTSSKSTCWDGDMRKTYKFYWELKILLKNFNYLSILAITIAMCHFNTHTSSKSICWNGDMRKTYKFYSELKILLKNLHYLSFLAITIAVCQIQMTLTLLPLQNEQVGLGMCAIHTNWILS